MRFVAPETIRLDLRDGPAGEKNWIEVRKRLTVGETQAYRTQAMRYQVLATDRGKEAPPPAIDVDLKLLAFTRALAYLVAWSEPRYPPTLENLRNLESEDFEEIDAAIGAHVEAQDALKNRTDGGGTPTSPSS